MLKLIAILFVLALLYITYNYCETSEHFEAKPKKIIAHRTSADLNTGNFDDLDDNSGIIDDSSELVLGENIVTYEQFPEESKQQIRRKYMTRDHAAPGEFKVDNYAQGVRGGNSDKSIDFIDESNDLMQAGYMENDQFTGNDETGGNYAPYAQEHKSVNKFKTSEIFDANNYLPSDKSVNPDWFDVVPDAISVKNRHLINVSKPIGINTVGSSLRNPSYDIRGTPACPKMVISPWMQSTIEPDTNFKSLCGPY